MTRKKAGPNETRNKVLGVLACGPATRSLLEVILCHPDLNATLSHLKKIGKIHIYMWLRGEGKRRSPSAVYMLGPGEDAPKLKPDRKAVQSRYYRNHREEIEDRRRAKQAKQTLKNPFIQLDARWFNLLRQKALLSTTKETPK